MGNEIIGSDNCPACLLKNLILERAPVVTRTYQLHCARCGDYDIAFQAILELKNLPENSSYRALISEWIWEQNSLGIVPRITPESLVWLSNRRRLPFFDRAKRLLIFLSERTSVLNTAVSYVDYPPIQAMLQTFDSNEVNAVAQFLAGRGWIRLERLPAGQACVLGDGFIQAEEWKGTRALAAQGFVAMWFDASTADAWENGLRKGIADAGYRPVRIDKAEHINKICDEIIVQIKRSRFLVADYTGHRAGVYYEAGFAAGREIPVILTCRKGELDKLHFDIRQFNCIDWETPAELADRLEARIGAVIGDGPLKIN
jgi:nucleoside 2-deoxyribosyltransferase